MFMHPTTGDEDHFAPDGERYRTLPQARYDLVVIGGGSAGLSAAELAATLGAKVALLDRERLGGECLYTGCVPSKALLHVAHLAQAIRAASEVGLDAQLEPVDWGRVAGYVQQSIQMVYDRSDNPAQYTQMGVDVAFGTVRFIADDRVAVNGALVQAKRFLIATGSHAAVPPISGLLEAGFLTNETAFAAHPLPARLVVLGGGPVGCELGQAFARLGSQVTIVQRPERLLPKDEPEASATLRSRFERENITVETQAVVQEVAQREGGKVVRFMTPAGMREIVVDGILVAVGRLPNVSDLDLEAAGVRYETSKGIVVDKHLRTSNHHIYAAGDVIGGYQFTHAAAVQARTAVRNALFPGAAVLRERVMPWATFTEPEVAHVGLTEAQARQRYGDTVGVFIRQFCGVDRAVTDRGIDGFVKLVSTRNGILLGAQIVGQAAGEYVNELALALQRRVSLASLAATTHVYPTLALAIQQAAGQYTTEKLRHNRLVHFMRFVRLLLR